MRRVLTTFAFGPQADLLGVSVPSFAAYAQMHGYDFFVPQEAFFLRREALIQDRAPSWLKVLLLIDLLTSYDEVVWLDADVVVCRYDRDIAEDATDAPMHMVVHQTADGSVPNCGVWHLRRPAIDILDAAWHRNSFARSDGWWEQAGVISALGGDPDATPTSTPPSEKWAELPYEWNPHVRDHRGIPASPRFFHATMFRDRRQAMLFMRAMP